MAFRDMRVDPAHEAVRDVLERRVLDALAVLLAPVEDLPGVVSKPPAAKRGEFLCDLGVVRRVDVHGVNARVFRLGRKPVEIVVRLPELEHVAEPLGNGQPDLIRG